MRLYLWSLSPYGLVEHDAMKIMSRSLCQYWMSVHLHNDVHYLMWNSYLENVKIGMNKYE